MAVDLTALSPAQIEAYKAAGVLDRLVEGDKTEQKHDIQGTPMWVNPAYNTVSGQPAVGGIFTQPGVRPEVFSTIVQPLDFLSYLNLQPSLYQNEIISILTGQLDVESGSNPSSACGTPITPGMLKKCSQVYKFGQAFLGSPKINLTQAGMLLNRAATPKVIQNFAANDPIIPDILQRPDVNLMSPYAQAMYQAGTMLRRAISQVAITGNPATANASVEPGFISEFNGLDTLIKTGYADAETSTACPAADSDVRTWNAMVDATVSSQQIAEVLNDLYYGRQLLAQELGMNGVQWAWIMHPLLLRELSFVYASQFYAYRSAGSAAAPVWQNQESYRQFQLAMQSGKFLPMGADQVPVIEHLTPLTTIDGNVVESDIYLVPMTWNGQPLVNFEYFPADNQYANEIRAASPPDTFLTLNNGMYNLTIEKTVFCIQAVLEGKFRMWLDTPFLAGRLDNVRVNNNIKFRGADPADTARFYNGGVTFRTVSTTTGI